MDDHKYDLRYLPLFYEDLEEKVLYISNVLHSSKSAKELLDAVENAIIERLPFCESFERFQSKKARKYPYYRIYVKNFVIFSVLIDDGHGKKTIEVRRLLYKKQERWSKLF